MVMKLRPPTKNHGENEHLADWRPVGGRILRHEACHRDGRGGGEESVHQRGQAAALVGEGWEQQKRSNENQPCERIEQDKGGVQRARPDPRRRDREAHRAHLLFARVAHDLVARFRLPGPSFHARLFRLRVSARCAGRVRTLYGARARVSDSLMASLRILGGGACWCQLRKLHISRKSGPVTHKRCGSRTISSRNRGADRRCYGRGKGETFRSPLLLRLRFWTLRVPRRLAQIRRRFEPLHGPHPSANPRRLAPNVAFASEIRQGIERLAAASPDQGMNPSIDLPLVSWLRNTLLGMLSNNLATSLCLLLPVGQRCITKGYRPPGDR